MTKEEFLKDVQNWNNHAHLLWEALELTKGEVVEMGMGQGSTPLLHQYCKDTNRRLYSYDNNLDWYSKFTHFTSDHHTLTYTIDWDIVSTKHRPSVVFIDHAPGERRKIDIERFRDRADIIVCHDTEPAADHGYQMRAGLLKFKYIKEFKSEGAWASMVSNTIKF